MICEDCGKRKAVVKFSDEPAFSITHSAVYPAKEICRQCYIKRIETELKKIKLNLIKEKRLLKNETRRRA